MGNVIDLKTRKRLKDEELTPEGRTPLYVSHKDGKVKGSPHLRSPASDDFGDRMQRIRQSLEKINQLMADLKSSSRNKDLND